MTYIIMGVCGCGKSTVGEALAKALGLPFHDADPFHPAANVAKMKAGIPLNDEDRQPWLENLAAHIRQWNTQGGAVLACSALKEKYRDILRSGGAVRFILVHGPKELLAARLAGRSGHFMNPALLDSQLATLEIPFDALHVDLALDTSAQVQSILNQIQEKR
ncbi:MAG: hypothetical protein RL095_2554 [Verrucomicrobiota bacterium]|jgi:carbohydrate kinase (thermoresistant glucokinase family)